MEAKQYQTPPSTDQSEKKTTGQSEKECPCPPYPPKPSFEIPNSCPNYDKIPSYIREEIDAARTTAQRTADNTHAESIQQAKDTKAEAQSQYTLAIAKYDSATKLLCDKIKNAKDELWPVYKQCVMDSIPNNCPKEEQYAPEDKRAICITKLEQGLSAKDVDFKTELQQHETNKSVAEAEWEKAQQAYDSAVSLADAVREKANQDAEVVWREALSQKLEEFC